ncbi:MAG: hypothetical protein A2X94_11600 [Bdellovibrionales bacterium GWB1_55_8]|nr:MAG: hypothetical protein A2X94_11600 [Bdellovibrionales bacterium GWB1_55_8]
MILCLSLVSGITLRTPVALGAESIVITLAEAEKRAVENSRLVGAAQADADAANARFSAQRSLRLPRLVLDGSFRAVSEIPQLNLPTGQSLNFSDNTSYSVGPLLQWVLLDFGSLARASRSAEELYHSRQQAVYLSRKQALLNARTAYFKVQLGLEQMRLLRKSLMLARAQHADISRRAQAGASSRMDVLSSHKEVLQLRAQFRQSVSDLASGLRNVYLATGMEHSADLAYPLDARLKADFAGLPDEPAVTAWVQFDLIEQSLTSLRPPEPSSATHPQILQLQHLAEASRFAAEGLQSALWPRIQVAAKTSLDYPNGPVLERIHQNTLSLSLSMPLFEFSRTSHEAGEKAGQALGHELRRDQAQVELIAQWKTAEDQLAGFRAQREELGLGVKESEELSRLIYQSYQAGRLSFIEVLSANLRALEARVQQARNEVQILLQLALLHHLSGGSS